MSRFILFSAVLATSLAVTSVVEGQGNQFPIDPKTSVIVRGHDHPHTGRSTGPMGVFHELFVVDPVTSWARRGAAAGASAAAMLRQTGRASAPVNLSIGRSGTQHNVSGTVLPARTTLAGTMKQAVVMVSFTDDADGPDSLPNRIFPVTEGELVDAYYGTGGGRSTWTTISQYYRNASGGKFDVAGQVVARITMPKSQAYYYAVGGRFANWDEFLTTATSLINAQVSPARAAEFSTQSVTGEALFGPVVFFHPGIDGACGAVRNIWAHRSGFRSTWVNGQRVYPRIGGVQAGDYIIQGTRCGSDAASRELVGPAIVIHETGHLIGLPDLYNTSGGVFNGVVTWDVMGGYSSLSDPGNLGAFSRVMLGWATVRDITVPATGDATVRLTPGRFTPTGGRDTVLAMRYGSDTNEVLLIENRLKTGIDRTIRESGGLFWYVNMLTAYPASYRPGGANNNLLRWILPTNNRDATRPSVIVIPSGARWGVANDGKPVIDTTIGAAALNLTFLNNVTWGSASAPRNFGPTSSPPWRSFVNGAAGNVIDQVTSGSSGESVLSLVVRGTSLLDNVVVTTLVTPRDTSARPVAGLGWAGVTVSTTGAAVRGLTRRWRVVDSAAMREVVLTPSADSTSVVVTARLPLDASGVVSIGVVLELLDGTQTRVQSVQVLATNVVVRPYTTITAASGAFLRGQMTPDGILFLDRHGNQNGAVDIGDLHLALSRQVLLK